MQKVTRELGEQLSEQDKQECEQAIRDLGERVAGDDREAIEVGCQRLTELSAKLAAKVQQSASAAEDAVAKAQESQESEPAQKAEGGDAGVVDADFEEVGDDKK